MHDIPGYETGETLYRGPASVVLRARAAGGGRAVVIKCCPDGDASARDLARLEQEYELGQSVRGVPELVEYLDVVPAPGNVALVLEDFGGRSLDRVLDDGPLEPVAVLRIGLQMVRGLEALHDAGIVHKNVAPANVIYDRASGTAKLGDLGIASWIPRAQQEACSPSHLEGTLDYLAPEQTGRMNRAIDFRADFYSLGATLYHALTGRPPFQGTDPMALVHAHVAVEAPSAHALRPEVPEAVARIVAKLMAKSAEDRYQSARGLAADLTRCLEAMERGEVPEPFDLGEGDTASTLCISQELYGREAEREALLDAFRRAAAGGCELALVRGQPGIGKSMLVHEVHRPVVGARGYFAQGKFDQLEMALPLSAVKDALRDLLRQILTESQDELAAWAARLRSALGDEGQALVDQLPELAHVIGEQRPVIELGPTEAQERFDRLLMAFMDEFATADHPLVLFIDDLQWVDAASLRLLRRLVTREGGHHLLVIGAYRDGEVSASHPLTLGLDRMREEGALIHTIDLGPLTRDDVGALVADSLDRTLEAVSPLSELIHQKTGGNPFFVTQLLRALEEDGIVRYSSDERAWVWDTEGIRTLEVLDNVVHLMVARIRRYEEETQRALSVASFLGSSFDLGTLAVVRDTTPEGAARSLWDPIRDGLVIPLDDTYEYYQWNRRERDTPPDPEAVRYKFAHDRIQEAAYSQIDAGERPAVHLRIGRLLATHLPEAVRSERVFDQANHFNAGAALVVDEAEKLRVAHLNLEAARKARSATAYGEARDYVRAGIAVLPEGSWEDHYALTFALHRERVDCEFLSGDLGTAEAVFADTAHRARTREDAGDLYQLMIRICHTADQHRRGMQLGQECLRLFDIELPDDPDEAQAVIADENRRIDELVGERSLASFLDHPLVEDRDMEISMGLLHETWTCAVMTGDFQQWILTAVKTVRLSLEHGHCKFSPCGYVAHAAVLALTGHHLEARDYGELSVALCHKFADPFIIPKVHNTFANFTNHFVHHLETNVALYEESYRNCLLSGDRWWGAWAVGFVRIGRWIKGDPIPEVLDTAVRFHDYIAGSGYAPLEILSAVDRHVLMNLRGLTDDPGTISAGEYREEDAVRAFEEIDFGWGLYCLHLGKSLIHLVHRDLPKAWDAIRSAEAHRDAIPGLMPYPDWFFYDVLIRAANHGRLDAEAQQASLEAMDAHIERMRAWEDLCPANFRHRRALMEAERARAIGEGALEAYETAVAAARENRYLHHEALAHELAGRFCLDRGWEVAGSAYVRSAHRRYERWGASVKVASLVAEFPELADASPRARGRLERAGVTTTEFDLGRLDIGSVMKAAQAISGELVLSRLLARLLEICVENAGAQKGALLMEHGGTLVVEARTAVSGETELPNRRLDESDDVPRRVVQYVRRTRSSVVLEDASRSELYRQDPYVQSHGVRSVLCLPVPMRGGRMAILYLENDLTSGAFTPDRVELLHMLAAQAATSLENAELFDTLEQKVADRTRELAEKNQQILQQQSMLVQSEKMASLGQLVAGVAHELNNPINFISGGVPSLERDIDKLAGFTPDDARDGRFDKILARIKKLLHAIDDGASRTAEIVQNLRSFSRLDEAEFKSADLHEALEATLTLLRSKIRDRIDVVRDYGRLPQVECAIGQVNQVLMNILTNALQAMDDGGTLTITTGTLDDDRVRLSIRDTGRGMDEQTRSRIFDPFFTTKDVGEGTGLGLSISHGIIERHRGTIEVRSEPGVGSEFLITLPVQAADEENA